MLVMRWFQPITRLIAWTTAAALLAAGAILAEDRVYPTASAVEPLAPGTRVPSARLKTVSGDPVELREVVDKRGALLVFYRGGW